MSSEVYILFLEFLEDNLQLTNQLNQIDLSYNQIRNIPQFYQENSIFKLEGNIPIQNFHPSKSLSKIFTSFLFHI